MSFTTREITDRSEWDLFFLKYNPTSLFHSWVWGEVQKKIGNKITRFGVYNSTKLVAILQLTIVQAKRGSFIHLRHGPILARNDIPLWKYITDELVHISKKEGVIFFRISPLVDSSFEEKLQGLGYKPAAIHAMDAELCWILPLDKSEDDLLKEMRKTTRYEIRRAQHLGVTITSTDSISQLNTFFRLYNETSKRQGFVPHKGISEEFELFAKEKEVLLFTADFEGECIAAAIILFTGGQAIYHHGASISHKIPGSYLIQWEAIKEAKKRGMNYYNFWGIAPQNQPNHPWQGITLFKKGFGGHELSFLHAHDYPVSAFYILPKAIETFRRIKKGY